MGIALRQCFWVFALVGLTQGSRYKHYHRVPIINLNGAEELVGTISEDEREVSLTPQLRILPDTGPICRYELSPINEDGLQDKELPFETKILNKSEGTVQIRLREGTSIDCTSKEWKMEVMAVRCADDSAKSEPVSLKITVKDTNNHVPQFEAPWYTFEVEEGKVGEVARIYATDADCGHPYGKICRYEITNALDGNPFEIDDQGVISTVHSLNRSHAESHILTVVAHDCGMLRSKSTLVTVHVLPKCVDGIRSDSTVSKTQKNVVHFLSGSDAKRIFDDSAELVMCPRDKCVVKQVESKMTLNLDHKSEVPFETVKECGLKPETLELLPHSVEKVEVDEVHGKQANSVESSDDQATDEEETEQKYFFDGKSNAVIVPANTIKGVVPEKFTLSFSMKHEAGSKQQQSVKQNLLCETDDFGMNRHHFAVYLRHCKLELLLRREAENAVGEFRAAEWRWESPAVCDGAWHSYAILFSDLDNVTLLVDGEKFESNDRNPEILDDWPLHQTKQHKTRLVVGACWHGRSQAMVQLFNGHLSSMFLLPGVVEPIRAIQCIHQNHERLAVHSIDHLVLGESVVFNHEQSQITLKASSLKDLTALFKEVEYVVDSDKKTVHPGKRILSVSSQVSCLDNRTIPLGTHQTEILLSQSEQPQLSITGLNLISANRRSLKMGSLMLPNLQITVTQNTDGVQSDETEKHKLSWCKVHLKPSRDMDLEYFSSPAAIISKLNVEFEHDKEGIMLKGEESVKAYTEVLTKIHYYNTHPASYNKRMYTVHCAMQGGKLVSNEFFVTMSIIDDSIEEAIEKLSSLSEKLVPSASEEPEDIMKLEKHFEPSFDQLGANRLQNILEMDLPRPVPKALMSHGYEVGGQGAVAGGAVAVVVVICIGFLLVLLVIGVLKMRDPIPKRRRNRKTTMEGMEWDDNGMNITVNPLELGCEEGNKAQQSEVYSEEESLEDEESYREEELTEDEEEETVLPHENAKQNGLEWDEETMPALNDPSVSKTYRV